VKTLVTNTTCSLQAGRGHAFARLPKTMRDKRTEAVPAGAYAVALDGEADLGPGRTGRVLVVADSGFLGEKESAWPGPGQIEAGDNRAFIRNAAAWLAQPAGC
jgi:hypothetical protein